MFLIPQISKQTALVKLKLGRLRGRAAADEGEPTRARARARLLKPRDPVDLAERAQAADDGPQDHGERREALPDGARHSVSEAGGRGRTCVSDRVRRRAALTADAG